MKPATVMLRTPQLSYTIESCDDFLEAFLKKSKLPREAIIDFGIAKKSFDTRHKRPVYHVSLDLWVHEAYTQHKGLKDCTPFDPQLVVPRIASGSGRVAIVGAGPSGLFAALALAEAGWRVDIFERGSAYAERARDVSALMRGVALHPDSNICYGEGGAGTFSDGKLVTRIKSPWLPYVMHAFTRFEAPQDILYEAKPHVGTDYLAKILRNLRAYLEGLGVTYHFGAKVTDFIVEKGVCRGIVCQGETLAYDAVVMATGHSEAPLIARLLAHGAHVEPKDLAIGFRIEHWQSAINRMQYGKYADSPHLPPAEYRLAHTTAKGIGVYSFCMCPGGRIVPSMTEPDTVVVNGMSSRARSGRYANAAILAQLSHKHFGEGPLAGFDYLRAIETRAAKDAPALGIAPSQMVSDFLAHRAAKEVPVTSYTPGVRAANVRALLPPFIGDAIAEALVVFDKKMRGFVAENPHIVGVETRSSSPVRVWREKNAMIKGITHLYFAGEGSGYAGGITSSAVDGLRIAEALAQNRTGS